MDILLIAYLNPIKKKSFAYFQNDHLQSCEHTMVKRIIKYVKDNPDKKYYFTGARRTRQNRLHKKMIEIKYSDITFEIKYKNLPVHKQRSWGQFVEQYISYKQPDNTFINTIYQKLKTKTAHYQRITKHINFNNIYSFFCKQRNFDIFSLQYIERYCDKLHMSDKCQRLKIIEYQDLNPQYVSWEIVKQNNQEIVQNYCKLDRITAIYSSLYSEGKIDRGSKGIQKLFCHGYKIPLIYGANTGSLVFQKLLWKYMAHSEYIWYHLLVTNLIMLKPLRKFISKGNSVLPDSYNIRIKENYIIKLCDYTPSVKCYSYADDISTFNEPINMEFLKTFCSKYKDNYRFVKYTK